MPHSGVTLTNTFTLPRQMVYGRSSTLRLGCHRPFALGDEKCRCCWILKGPSALCYTSGVMSSMEVSAGSFELTLFDFLGKWSMGGQPQGT